MLLVKTYTNELITQYLIIMADRILDYFDDFDEHSKVIAIRYFSFESAAHIYAAHLKKEGIPCFLSNSHISTALPLGGTGDVSLHVKAQDAQAAKAVLDFLDKATNQQDFREATLEEIEFERQANQSLTKNYWFWIIIIIVFLLILRAFFRASGLVFSDWDVF